MLAIFISCLSGQEVKTERYIKKCTIDENGNRITMRQITGYPPAELPISNYTPPKTMEKGIFFALDNVAGYDWAYGCMPTATAMLVAYYDHHGVVDVYTGTEGSGLAPITNATWNSQASTPGTSENPIAGTNQDVDGRDKKGHSDDYWTDYGDEATDPYYGAWAEHAYHEAGYNTCTADYMGSNQWYTWQNADGYTTIWSSASGLYDYSGSEGSTPALRDGIHGLRLFWEALDYTVDINYTRTITGYNDPNDDPDQGPVTNGFSFEMYMNEIDQGLPVIVQLEGHSMLGYGYDNTDELNPKVVIRDTWSYDTSDTHVMDWCGEYSNMQHYAVSVIHLGTESGWFPPQNVLALNNNRTVTVTWDDPSKGTANMNYEVYRDDVLQATVTTEFFQEVFLEIDDGLHTYNIKSIYVDEPYITLPSMSSSVFVCASVTEFHDDFESGDGQWFLSDGWGLCQEYFQSGFNSLSESPNANYVNFTDQLPEGGSVGEIAPGLNFAAAADASMDFWFRYDIETSFDYMHLQTCKDGLNWVSIKVWDGETPAWAQEYISLGIYAGESNVRIRFLFISDPGYTAEGSNIDDLNIVSTAGGDVTPPHVWYSKDKDYYDNNPDGFEIVTDITDFSGVDYARVLYNVNGGSEQTISAWQIFGDTYYFTIPQQTAGDNVEFRFDCQDSADPPNQGYTGPFFYQAGLHQKFDDGFVSYYSELVTTTAQYDLVAHANKFNSFHEDIVGVVIRGYDDASQPDDNSDMLIHVWADDNGLPGPDLIIPVQVPNPATLAETNKWVYVDLSGYMNLWDMTGDYYIGITCAPGGPSNVTRTVLGVPAEYGGYDFQKAYFQFYMENGYDLTWEQNIGTLYHIRAVTTNRELIPGTMDPVETSFSRTIMQGETPSDILTVENVGDFTCEYTASMSFDYAGVVIEHDLSYDTFDVDLGNWIVTGSPDYQFGRVIDVDGNTLNGTPFCYVNSWQGAATIVTTEYLTSEVFDTSEFEYIFVDFDHIKTLTSFGALEVFDGSSWQRVFTVTEEGTWNDPVHKHIDITAYKNAEMQVRFYFTAPKYSGSWSIDNVKIWGTVPYPWMTLDGGETTSDSVIVGGSDEIQLDYDPTGLPDGHYTATIKLTAPLNDDVEIPVSMIVWGVHTPANIVTSFSEPEFLLNWDNSANAYEYRIYSSIDPDAEFPANWTLEATVTESIWIDNKTRDNKKFYKIVAIGELVKK